MAQFNSKHGIVSAPQMALFMAFTDMRNFVNMLPEDKKQGVTADFDTLRGNVSGFDIGVRITAREPYKYIEIQDDGAPFHFTMSLHFEPAGEAGKTDFSITVEAELNMMLKIMIGNKINEALDNIVDSLVAMSEGRRPEGMPEDFHL
ncbi:MAG: hypothetical protein J5632_03655 [Bacteroidales bacterium]|nr:hypothetical protein [Bacteroidales bacterium]